jgi:hypothetical protein
VALRESRWRRRCSLAPPQPNPNSGFYGSWRPLTTFTPNPIEPLLKRGQLHTPFDAELALPPRPTGLERLHHLRPISTTQPGFAFRLAHALTVAEVGLPYQTPWAERLRISRWERLSSYLSRRTSRILRMVCRFIADRLAPRRCEGPRVTTAVPSSCPWSPQDEPSLRRWPHIRPNIRSDAQVPRNRCPGPSGTCAQVGPEDVKQYPLGTLNHATTRCRNRIHIDESIRTSYFWQTSRTCIQMKIALQLILMVTLGLGTMLGMRGVGAGYGATLLAATCVTWGVSLLFGLHGATRLVALVFSIVTCVVTIRIAHQAHAEEALHNSMANAMGMDIGGPAPPPYADKAFLEGYARGAASAKMGWVLASKISAERAAEAHRVFVANVFYTFLVVCATLAGTVLSVGRRGRPTRGSTKRRLSRS